MASTRPASCCAARDSRRQRLGFGRGFSIGCTGSRVRKEDGPVKKELGLWWVARTWVADEPRGGRVYRRSSTPHFFTGRNERRPRLFVEECRVSRNKVSLFILLFLPCAMIFPTKFWSLSGLASGDKVHYLDLVVIELFWIFLLVHVLLILPLTHDLIYFGFVLRICRSSSY
jgi:hypothetical protein